MHKISIVIPVYNVDKYLAECLDSVINQTYKNLEIICVDDCSTDNSRQILEEYSSKDNRIKIIYNENNLGPGLTRNKGIEFCTGDFIHFLDSDDWMELDSYEKLVNIISENQVDVVQFGYKTISNIDCSIINTYVYTDLNKVYNIDNEYDFIYSYTGFCSDKLIKTKKLRENEIIFKNYPCYEDNLVSFLVLINSSNVIFSDECFYNYRKLNNDSITANYEKYIKYFFKYFIELIKKTSELNQIVREKLLIREFSRVFVRAMDVYNKKAIKYDELKHYLEDIDYKVFSNVNLQKGYLAHAQEIIKYPELIFNLKNSFRNFIKEKCPNLFKILLLMKG